MKHIRLVSLQFKDYNNIARNGLYASIQIRPSFGEEEPTFEMSTRGKFTESSFLEDEDVVTRLLDIFQQSRNYFSKLPFARSNDLEK